MYSNAGTTGAAGIRGFQAKEPLPYSLSLLYFVRSEDGSLRLEAVDGVHVADWARVFPCREHLWSPAGIGEAM